MSDKLPFDEKHPDEPKMAVPTETHEQQRIRKLEHALALAMKALNFVADTCQRGEEHE